MARKRIFVVEDEEEIQELVRYNLTKGGFVVSCTDSGEEALRKIPRERPDLVVLDLMLPGVDGLEVCRSLKSESTTRDIPIIMLTAKSEEADVVTGLELGADDYITKPFSPRVLTARIRAALASRHDAAVRPRSSVIRSHNILIHPGRHEVLVDDAAGQFDADGISRPADAGDAARLGVHAQPDCRFGPRWRTGGDRAKRRRAHRRPAEEAGGCQPVDRDGPRRRLPVQGMSPCAARASSGGSIPTYLVITLAALLAITLHATHALKQFHIAQVKVGLASTGAPDPRRDDAAVRRRETSPQVQQLCERLGAEASTRITVVLGVGPGDR